MLIIKEKTVPECLDKEGDFVLAFLRACEVNLWEFKLGCIIEDDVLAGFAIFVG